MATRKLLWTPATPRIDLPRPGNSHTLAGRWRFLSLDGAGELQTTWRKLDSSERSESGDEVVAQLNGPEPKQLHMPRVTALDAGGATLWESPLVALAPPRVPSRRGRRWLLFLGLALLVFLLLRWRTNRAAA